ncbi:hypothetical protein AGIG_G1141 [Arapaima gigas]
MQPKFFVRGGPGKSDRLVIDHSLLLPLGRSPVQPHCVHPLRTRWPVGGEIMLGCLVFHTHWNQQEWQKHEPTRDLPCEGGSCELQGATP